MDIIKAWAELHEVYQRGYVCEHENRDYVNNTDLVFCADCGQPIEEDSEVLV